MNIPYKNFIWKKKEVGSLKTPPIVSKISERSEVKIKEEDRIQINLWLLKSLVFVHIRKGKFGVSLCIEVEIGDLHQDIIVQK